MMRLYEVSYQLPTSTGCVLVRDKDTSPVLFYSYFPLSPPPPPGKTGSALLTCEEEPAPHWSARSCLTVWAGLAPGSSAILTLVDLGL